MQKIVHIVVLYIGVAMNTFAGISSPIVTLSGGGNVLPASSTSISLNGIVSGATYSVVCYVDTTYPFQYILLSSNLSDVTSTIISYSLNGNYVTQDQLMVGHNLVVINGRFTSPANSSIVITNLDQANSFNVNNCFAMPIQAISRNNL